MSKHMRNDMLAAEYVLGTLRGPARRRFEDLMEQEPALALQVQKWQEVLGTLDASDVPVQPPARVWRTIQLRLPQQQSANSIDDLPFEQSPPAASTMQPHFPVSWKTRIFQHRWQFASAALAAALVTILVWPGAVVLDATRPATTPMVVLASTQSDHPDQIVVSFDDTNQQLIVTPLNLPTLSAEHSLELWLIGENQRPESLGLIKPEANTTITINKIRLAPKATLAISLEPIGGSPTGQPTGSVLYAGKIGKV